MARQGKSQDSPSKSTSKKVKRAAVKALLDITAELSRDDPLTAEEELLLTKVRCKSCQRQE